MDDIRTTLSCRNIDIFVCVETWFTSLHDLDTVSINGYVCLRADRIGRIGGGVAIWIRDSYVVCPIQCDAPQDIECLVVKLPSFRLILLAVYLPPDVVSRSSQRLNDFFVTCLDSVLDSCPEYDVIFAGDLNRFDIGNLCSSFNLKNINNQPTYGKAELDFILFSDTVSDNYVIKMCPPFDVSKVPHYALHAIPALQSEKTTSIERKVLDLRPSFVNEFVLRIAEENWNFMEDVDLTLDEKCERFHQLLEDTVDECIPSSPVHYTRRDKPWITPVVKELINKRWQAFRCQNFEKYMYLKTKVRKEINKAKFVWTKRMEQTDVWKAVNCHRGKDSSLPIMSLVSQYESVDAAVNAINTYLQSVFTRSSEIDTCNLSTVHDKDWNPDVTPTSVETHLKRLSKRKSSPDIPNLLYKSAAPFLALPLSKLMKLCLESCSIPKLWKKGSVVPIPKTRAPKLEDIRPISLLPTPVKILEKIVLTSMKEQLLQNYGRCQFGFRPGSSTQCALVSLHNYVTRHLDDSSTFAVLLISYDYSKAFDRLRSDIVINRLKDCNFPKKRFC